MIDLQHAAGIALACLDLTSLNANDNESDIVRLCERAQGRYGAVAAVCVWPQFVALARAHLPAHIAVAAVANFPHGGAEIAVGVAQTRRIVQSGAQEVDLVLPYRSLMAGDVTQVAKLLEEVRAACSELVLKVILETGELTDAATIAQAARISLEAGADFLKTSTGKTAISATPDAVQTMLTTIRSRDSWAQRAGIKASGGIRTVKEAAVYIALVQEALGDAALCPSRFRLGASSLLDDIEAVLAGASPREGGTASSY